MRQVKAGQWGAVVAAERLRASGRRAAAAPAERGRSWVPAAPEPAPAASVIGSSASHSLTKECPPVAGIPLRGSGLLFVHLLVGLLCRRLAGLLPRLLVGLLLLAMLLLTLRPLALLLIAILWGLLWVAVLLVHRWPSMG
jgi:hypothetical protein